MACKSVRGRSDPVWQQRFGDSSSINRIRSSLLWLAVQWFVGFLGTVDGKLIPRIRQSGNADRFVKHKAFILSEQNYETR